MEKNDNVKKKIEPLICDLSGVYERMYPEKAMIDMTDISGTNCYCDDIAAKDIRNRLKDADCGGVHFIDSGNYHYMTCFFLEKIQVPFALILIDHHSDMQMPAFGNILSCGGWVKYTLDSNEFLNKVYIIGAADEEDERIEYIESGDSWPGSELPVYLSIDKDVLSSDHAATDWDQGDMSLDELLSLINEIKRSTELIGTDICGEKKEGVTESEVALNIQTNAKLLEALGR